MSMAEVSAGNVAALAKGTVQSTVQASAKPAPAAVDPSADIIGDMFRGEDKREKFIPVTRQALMERLARQQYWPGNEAQHVRRFFRYLDYWRKQTYSARLLDLEHTYEPFSPDSDLLITRQFSARERDGMRSGWSPNASSCWCRPTTPRSIPPMWN